MSDNKSKRKYIVVAILAALLLVGGTITAVCIANSNNNAVQVAEQSTQSTVQSSVAESSTESTTAESSTVSENSTKENSAAAQTSKTAQESSNTSSKAETSKTETPSKPETSKTESSTTPQPNKQPSNNNNTTTTKPSNNNNTTTTKPSNNTTTTPTKPTTIDVTSISLDRSSATLTVGDKITLVATVNPGSATNKSYEFSSSNNDVATVNSSGTVVAKKAGSCTITVKSSNGKTAKCSVTVKAKASNGSNTSGNNGDTSSTIQKMDACWATECPEITKYINKYRAAEGLAPVEWYSVDYVQRSVEERMKDPMEKLILLSECPNKFDSNGNFIAAKQVWESNTQSTRNAANYMRKNQTISHSDNYNESAGIQLSGGRELDYEDWMQTIKKSPLHWKNIVNIHADSVYACYSVNEDGTIRVAIDIFMSE